MMRLTILLILAGLCSNLALGSEDEFEHAPIEYSKAVPDNVVSRLQQQLEQGERALEYAPDHGYLPALLNALQIPFDSQMLVFSKTSLQRSRISAQTPRALYFNDDVYVGYCHAGDVLEVSVADATLGAVFYSLEQDADQPARLERQTHKCLLCHSTSQTGNYPSHLVRSVFADASGLPLLAEGSVRVDHTTPLEQRWGGWYVTGSHGSQSHLGNLIVRQTPVTRPVQNANGLNVVDLAERFPVEHYLTPHSDIVALMVLEHQTLMHNLITKASFDTRRALHYESEFNRTLGEPANNRLDSTTRRIANAGEKLLQGLLFTDEAPLTAPLVGTSGFAASFAVAGPHDDQQRSLRDLDLQSRLFKYPCSYLIYSPAFEALPNEMKSYLASRLRVLLGDPTAEVAFERTDDEEDFAHLSKADRRAILEILQATQPEVLSP